MKVKWWESLGEVRLTSYEAGYFCRLDVTFETSRGKVSGGQLS